MPLPPAEIDDALAVGGAEIDATTVATRMTVPVRINGAGPYRFVVDSGADTSVIADRLAGALALPAGRRTVLHSITDSQLVDRVRVAELTLGPTRVRELELPVLRASDLGADGMLGLDALVEQRLMLDFERQVIAVDDARVQPERADGEIVVTARLRKGQLILTDVRADGRRVEAVVDTGSQITIGNLALRELLVRRNAVPLARVELTSVTGTTATLDVARIAELTLGSVTLRGVGIAFADVPPFAMFAMANRPALLLGTDLMAAFRKVSLDFRARKVRFQLRRCEGAARAGAMRGGYTMRMKANSAAACSR